MSNADILESIGAIIVKVYTGEVVKSYVDLTTEDDEVVRITVEKLEETQDDV